MGSLRPIISTTGVSNLPLHTPPSPTRRPPLIPRRSLPALPVIVNASYNPEVTTWRSAFRSTPPVASAVRAAASGGALIWEERIEKAIYRCRFLTLFGVLGSLMGSVLCYLKGCVYVMNSFTEYFSSGGGRVILTLVEAIDIYLIGTVMLVFGMGLYELFISNIDVAMTSSHGSSFIGLFKLPGRPKWLEIQSVSELKTKVGHVIVLVLLIGMFDNSKKVTISSCNDLLYFAASVLFSSGCIYLLSMLLQTSK